MFQGRPESGSLQRQFRQAFENILSPFPSECRPGAQAEISIVQIGESSGSLRINRTFDEGGVANGSLDLTIVKTLEHVGHLEVFL